MNVAVDGFEWRDRPTGVGRFLTNLLGELAPTSPDDRFVVFLAEPLRDTPAWPNTQFVVQPHDAGYLSWQNATLPRLIARYGCDRLLAPNNTGPFRPGVPTLLVVHDVSWRATPSDYTLRHRLSLDLRSRWSLRRAGGVVAVSQFTADEVARWYGPDVGPVEVVRHGLQPGLERAGAAVVAAFKNRHALHGKTVIGFLGAQFGRRHIAELVQAVARLRRDREAVLLLAGPNRMSESQAEPDPDWLRRIPWLPEEDTAAFYSSLDLSCYLSDYEGFGLPPMESLQCGTVPLLLAGSSLSELYGGAALFEPVPDPEGLAATMRRFLDAPSERTALLAHWTTLAGRFSWNDAARKYHRLLATLGQSA